MNVYFYSMIVSIFEKNLNIKFKILTKRIKYYDILILFDVN